LRSLAIFRTVKKLFARPQAPAPEMPSSDGAALKSRGNALLAEGSLADAAACYRQACELAPQDAAAFVNLGYALLEQGLAAEALNSLLKACALNPASHEALYMVSLAQVALGKTEEAADTLNSVLRLQPGFGMASRDRTRLLLELERWQDALVQAEDLLRHEPEAADARLFKARALYGLSQHGEALAMLENVLHGDASDIGALLGKGTVLFALKRYEEALAIYSAVLALDPGNHEALANTGAAWERLGDFERAMAFHEKAQAGGRSTAAVLYNMGSTLLGSLRCRDAIEVSERGLAEYPQDADLHWNKAVGHLLLGELSQGWDSHEWRWKLKAHGHPIARDDRGRPAWTGFEPLEGKSVLVMPEQGLGDTIQFMRYLPLLAARGARVVFCVPASLASIAAQIGECELVLAGMEVPATDYIVHMLSLPRAFATTLASVPPQEPPLRSAPAGQSAWQTRLGAATGPRIGLVWSGNAGHHNDGNRSIPLRALSKLRSQGFEFVSLQQEVRDSDAEALLRSDILDVRDGLKNFGDTAALIDCMDLVISVDTSVAHLAGAMGKPVWVLLPYQPDWRWMLDRGDSPWYPGTRLFRQDRRRTWEPVISQVRAELQALAARSLKRPASA
jgi:tetratricopeptide (TPR) repeat protein